MKTLLIDLDGVLYEGEEPIDGAADAIGWVRSEGIPHLFLTNTTSRPRSALVDKLEGMDIPVEERHILTPPVAAARSLASRSKGPVALFVAPATVPEFDDLEIAGDDADEVAAVVIGDYGEHWTYDELNRAFRLLMKEPKPALVALGMTRYWKAEDGLRLDTAPFVVALAHASGVDPEILGKPARAFFDTALSILDADAGNAVLVGDDVRSDIGGAQQAGITGVLVRTGKFRTVDLEGDVRPDHVIDSIAELPDRWDEFSGS